MSYCGRWQLAYCKCWSAGGVHKTSAKNATVTLKVPLPWNNGAGAPYDEWQRRTHVGLVMHAGPNRGKFQVWVNDVLRATVDTYARVDTPRMLVYQTAITDYSTIKLVNLATKGRPRIDFDAVLTD